MLFPSGIARQSVAGLADPPAAVGRIGSPAHVPITRQHTYRYRGNGDGMPGLD